MFSVPLRLVVLSGPPSGGPNNQPKFTAIQRPVVPVAGGRPIQHQTAKHEEKACRKPSSRQVCVFFVCSGVMAQPGVQSIRKMHNYLCVLFAPRRLKEPPPEGDDHKTLVSSDRNWGVFLLCAFSSSALFVKGLCVFCCGLCWRPPWCLLGAPLGTARSTEGTTVLS